MYELKDSLEDIDVVIKRTTESLDRLDGKLQKLSEQIREIGGV